MSYYDFSGYATDTGHPKPETSVMVIAEKEDPIKSLDVIAGCFDTKTPIKKNTEQHDGNGCKFRVS